MGRMWRGGYRRFHPIGDRMGNEMVDVFDVGQPICDLDMEYGIYKVPAKEVIPYRIYPVLSPAWKADGYDELGKEYFPKSIYRLVSDKSGYCLHRF